MLSPCWEARQHLATRSALSTRIIPLTVDSSQDWGAGATGSLQQTAQLLSHHRQGWIPHEEQQRGDNRLSRAGRCPGRCNSASWSCNCLPPDIWESRKGTRFVRSPGWHFSGSAQSYCLWQVQSVWSFCHRWAPCQFRGRTCLVTHRTSRLSPFPRTGVLSPTFLLQFPVCNSCCTFYPSAQAASLPPVLQAQWPLLHQPWLAHTPAVSTLKWGCPPPWKQEAWVKTNHTKRAPKSRR